MAGRWSAAIQDPFFTKHFQPRHREPLYPCVFGAPIPPLRPSRIHNRQPPPLYSLSHLRLCPPSAFPPRLPRGARRDRALRRPLPPGSLKSAPPARQDLAPLGPRQGQRRHPILQSPHSPHCRHSERKPPRLAVLCRRQLQGQWRRPTLVLLPLNQSLSLSLPLSLGLAPTTIPRLARPKSRCRFQSGRWPASPLQPSQ